jgi:hypothetical protein
MLCEHGYDMYYDECVSCDPPNLLDHMRMHGIDIDRESDPDYWESMEREFELEEEISL